MPKPTTGTPSASPTPLEDRIVELEAQLTAIRGQQNSNIPAQITTVPQPPPAKYLVIYNQTRNAISFMGATKNEDGYTIEPKQAEKQGYIILPGEEGLKLKNNHVFERLTSGNSAPLRAEWTDKAPARSDLRPERMLKLPTAGQMWVEEVVYQSDEKAEALIDTHWIDEDGTGVEEFDLYRTDLVPKLQAARDYLQVSGLPYAKHRIMLITKRLKEIQSRNL